MANEEPGARLIDALAEAIELLRADGEPWSLGWADGLEKQRNRLLQRDGGATVVLLTWYGGMGSLNDTVLSGDEGDRLARALSTIYDESRKLGRELDLL